MRAILDGGSVGKWGQSPCVVDDVETDDAMQEECYYKLWTMSMSMMNSRDNPNSFHKFQKPIVLRRVVKDHVM